MIHIVAASSKNLPTGVHLLCMVDDQAIFTDIDPIVRFSDFHIVHRLEGFCYNLLLARFPVKFEDEPLSAQGKHVSQGVHCT